MRAKSCWLVSSRTKLRLGLTAAGLLAALGLALPSPAVAGGIPTPWEVHKKIHKSVERSFRHLGEIPRRIHASHVAAYRSFFGGRTYDRGHRHYHTSYRFPVYLGGRVVYRPYSYCNDSLIVARGVPLPPLVVGVQAGSRYPVVRGGYVDSYDDDYYVDDRYDDRGYDRGHYDRDRDRRDYRRHRHNDYDDDDDDCYRGR